MKQVMRRMLAWGLAALLTLTPALAAPQGETQGTSPTGQTGASLSYNQLEQLVREHSPTIQMLELQIDAALHNDSMDEAIDALWMMYEITGNGEYVQQALQLSQSVTLSSSEKEKLQIQWEQTVESVVNGAQTLFLTWHSLERQRTLLQRTQASLERTLETAEKSYELGLISQLQLEQAQSSCAQVEEQRKSLSQSQNSVLQQLNLLLGRDYDEALTLKDLPNTQEGFLSQRDAEADLQESLENNFTLRLSQNALDQFDDIGDSEALKKQKEAAQLQVQQDERQVHYDFAAAQQSITAAELAIQTAQESLRYQQLALQAAANQYRLGVISYDDYLAAEDSCASASVTVQEKYAELLVAQQSYLHLVNGLSGTSAQAA